MTLRHIRIFLEVYRACNVTRAAENLHMTQPAVTRAIQEMEQHYGVRLFERMYHRLSPTESAKKVYPQAAYLLDGFDRIENTLHACQERGQIRVGATMTLGSTLLPALTEKFSARHPECEMYVQVGNGSAIAEALCENQLDMVLLENGVPKEELHCENIGTDELCAVLAKKCPLAAYKALTPEQLAQAKLLVREKGSTARSVLESAAEARGLTLHLAWESVSTDALVQAAVRGLGIAILPQPVAEQYAKTEEICLRTIEDLPLVRRRVLVWHKEKYITPAMQQFAELCRGQG